MPREASFRYFFVTDFLSAQLPLRTANILRPKPAFGRRS